jgi:protein-tyrosine phosphatase
VIDLHSHVLPGLDDGVRTIEEARELARAAAADGVRALAATPHVRLDYPTRPGAMEAGVEALRADFERERVPVELLHGGEVALDVLWEIEPGDLRRFTLAQTGRYLLLEVPYRGPTAALLPAVRSLGAQGIAPVLAHPERNPFVQDRPDSVGALVEAGALVQLTAVSLDPERDRAAERAARTLLDLGLVHLVGSDAHGPHIPREVGLGAVAELLGDAGLARHLTEDVPAAIVAGEPVPAVV